MVALRWPGWNIVLPLLAWMVLLALLPWWLGLPLLFALAAVVLLLQHRLAAGHAASIRRGLRWGLPGVLFALQRTLGGDAFAWGAALLGALAGYTLLAGLEAWLDRGQRRDPSAALSPEWPELAMAPIGPAAEIIELQLPAWQYADSGLSRRRLPVCRRRQHRWRRSARGVQSGGMLVRGAHAQRSRHRAVGSRTPSTTSPARLAIVRLVSRATVAEQARGRHAAGVACRAGPG